MRKSAQHVLRAKTIVYLAVSSLYYGFYWFRRQRLRSQWRPWGALWTSSILGPRENSLGSVQRTLPQMHTLSIWSRNLTIVRNEPNRKRKAISCEIAWSKNPSLAENQTGKTCNLSLPCAKDHKPLGPIYPNLTPRDPEHVKICKN